MSGSLNLAIIVGNVGNAPEVRTFQNGDKVCNFSVATSESWKDKSTGERKEKTEWHRISILNQNLVNVAEKFLTKGIKVSITGQIQTRKYTDNSGVERYTTEVVLGRFSGQLIILGDKNHHDAAPPPATTKTAQQPSAPDDDIPF